MTEPIKQEIINNIFENGDKLITGPILQTVLIDMIDDVNVKDQEILSKTGSWDDAATQIPNLATKAELTEAKDGLQANITNLSESVARDLENVVDVDLTGYATEQWVESQGYLKEHQDISNLATKTELTQAENNLQGNITSLSESVARDLANVSVPEGVATEAWVQSQDYASKSYVDNAVSSSSVDLTGYATETWVQNQGYLKEHQDISNLATKTELNDTKDNLQGNITSLSESVARDLTGYATEQWVQSQGYLTEHQDISNLATKTELTSVSESVKTDITNLSESVANSAVWKKGTGTDSIVQKLTGDREAKTPTATGYAAIAIGLATTASGYLSHAEGKETKALSQACHAEGYGTIASGTDSHAEGLFTTSSGDRSHAEGKSTVASGSYSHAEGSDTVASGYGSHTEGYQTSASNDYSHAEGFRAKASGMYSHAEGSGSIASETGSHAEGFGTTAEGNYSHAEGRGARAWFGYSHAEGWDTTTSGMYSHAEGNYTKADGESSHAEGRETKALGNSSHAEGWGTVASNEYEHAQGMYNLTSSNQIFSIGAGEYANGSLTRRNAVSVLAVKNSDNLKYTASFFVQNIGGYDGTNPEPGTNDLATVISGLSSGGGSSETLWKKGEGQDSIVQVIADVSYPPTATGTGSIATGYSTKASGTYSHAEGYYTKASGEASHAEGYFANASGSHSHAEGYFANASGSYSHAEGNYANALGWSSHAEGYSTDASGSYSHAEGYDTNASNEASHAEGIKTTASGNYSHAEGCLTSTTNRYEHAQGIANHNSTNQIFSVGAGEIDNPYSPDSTSAKTRKNAVSILAVPNSETQVVTASFFVQNVGGYDGTNPEPGTNDLATVLNNTETWTFTLEDGSTVTKNVRIS